MELNAKSLHFNQQDLFNSLSKYYQKKYVTKIIDYQLFFDSKKDMTYLKVNFKNKKVVEFQYNKKFISQRSNTMMHIFLFDLINALKHN